MGRLIGLTGLAGSGKDTAALALIADGFVREAFADRMRKAMLALDPWVDRFPRDPIRLSRLVHREGWDHAKREYPEVRRLLQRFGTEAGRNIHGTDCWVNLLVRDWCSAGKPDTVVTDVRFENEARAVRDLGGTVIRIVRPDQTIIGSSDHSSEAGFPEELVDIHILKDGTVEDLHWQIRYAVDHYDVEDPDA